MTAWLLIGGVAAYIASAIFVGKFIAYGMGSKADTVCEAFDAAQAGRTLAKLSDAEYQRRKAAKTAELRAELGL